jgi:enediyne biosynthesis protein E4
VGARVTLTTASGRKLYNHAGPSTGLLSSSDKRLHFGLGGETMVRLLEVEWPGGKRQTVREVAAGRHLRVEEPR